MESLSGNSAHVLEQVMEDWMMQGMLQSDLSSENLPRRFS